MNCFSACQNYLRRFWPVLALLLIAACGVSDSADSDTSLEYSVHYLLSPEPAGSAIVVELELKQPRSLLREISFPDAGHIDVLAGSGDLTTFDGRVHWQPPATGGTLRWRATIHSERGDGVFDALLSSDWGVFRMEDAIPRARARTLRGAYSRTTFDFDLPADWSVVTEYSAIEKPVVIDRPARRLDEPTGWVAIGKLGVRRERIGTTSVIVAGPEDHGVRRMDMLALLNWTLPELATMLPEALPRLTIVSAAAPMWRGGLSGPASFYIHADRPLISENATSALLHEVMHTALNLRPRPGHDWIAEGLAEYYSIELLRRGRAITTRRAATAMEKQDEWSTQATDLCGNASTAETTALAVTIFARLDKELLAATGGDAGLDELLPGLVGQEVDLAMLVQAATQLTGATPDALHIDRLPGCLNIS